MDCDTSDHECEAVEPQLKKMTLADSTALAEALFVKREEKISSSGIGLLESKPEEIIPQKEEMHEEEGKLEEKENLVDSTDTPAVESNPELKKIEEATLTPAPIFSLTVQVVVQEQQNNCMLVDNENGHCEKKRVMILGDGHARSVALRLFEMVSTDWKVEGIVKPDAKTIQVLENVKLLNDFTKKDFLVLIAGTIDVAEDKSIECFRALLQKLPELSHTNVIIVSIPQRYDLTSFSTVHEEINKTNRKIFKLVKSLPFVKFVDHPLNRKYYTDHGKHLNYFGKNELLKVIRHTLLENQNVNAGWVLQMGWVEGKVQSRWLIK